MVLALQHVLVAPGLGLKATLGITQQLAGSKTERPAASSAAQVTARGGDLRLHGWTPALFLARESSSVFRTRCTSRAT